MGYTVDVSLHRTLITGAMLGGALLGLSACGDFKRAPDAPVDPSSEPSSSEPLPSDPSELDGGANASDARPDARAGDAPAGDASPDASRANVSITFQGCAVNLTSSVVVVADAKSIAVSRTGQPFSSLQLDLKNLTGSVALSTAQRIATHAVVNATDPTGTWTNISSQTPDPIGGTLIVRGYDLATGVVDVEFVSVRLQNLSDKTMCTLNGTLTTTGKSF